MLNTNATNFRKDVFMLLEQAVKYNEHVNISTKEGNAVLVSEHDYNNMIETLYLNSNAAVRDSIIEGLNTPLEECVPENKVNW